MTNRFLSDSYQSPPDPRTTAGTKAHGSEAEVLRQIA
jgi:hypothetical protein